MAAKAGMNQTESGTILATFTTISRMMPKPTKLQRPACWRARTGAAWRAAPERVGSRGSACGRPHAEPREPTRSGAARQAAPVRARQHAGRWSFVGFGIILLIVVKVARIVPLSVWFIPAFAAIFAAANY